MGKCKYSVKKGADEMSEVLNDAIERISMEADNNAWQDEWSKLWDQSGGANWHKYWNNGGW